MQGSIQREQVYMPRYPPPGPTIEARYPREHCRGRLADILEGSIASMWEEAGPETHNNTSGAVQRNGV